MLLTPNPGPRFGNFLYYWLHASILQRAGVDYRVQTHAHLDPWLDLLPGIRERYSVPVDGLAWRDRREWPPPEQFQVLGQDFQVADVAAFARETLLPAPALSRRLDADVVVVNVRRGDYYSRSDFRAAYGFDIRAYVEEGLRRMDERSPVRSVRIISDGLDWCREHLDDVIRPFDAAPAWGPGTASSPVADLAVLAGAARLVGANSTFSYWGAYLAEVRRPDAHIVMPGFHSRLVPDGRAYQVLPTWDVVDDLPGGWTAPS